MHQLPRLFCVCFLVAACHDDSGGELGSRAPVSTSLGVAVDGLSGYGDLWLATVPEAGQGGRDLNGDGDALDHVAHVLDLATGVLTSTSLAVSQPSREPLGPVGDGRVVLLVSEADQGETDLNGDGDARDDVLHFFTARSAAITNLALAVHLLPPFVGEPMFRREGVLPFVVTEEEQQRDLDGDGLVEPQVGTLHLHHPVHGLLNVGVFPGTQPYLHDGFLGLTVPESTADLDGDGDTADFRVLHFFELATGRLVSAGVDLGTNDLVAGGGLFVVAVSERTSGFQDLNFDGDRDDAVFRAIDPASGVHTELGFTAFTNALFPPLVTADGRILLAAGEEDGIDRNGDGDRLDLVPVVFDPRTKRVFEPGLELHYTAQPLVFGKLLALPVSEDSRALDLNGDGDRLDAVMHVVEPARSRVRNLGIAVLGGAIATPDLLVMTVFEDMQGADLDGDGSLGEAVPFVWDASSGRLTNTRLSTTGAAFEGGGRELLFLGREEVGPTFRFEFQLYDAHTGRSHRLGLESSLTYFAGMGTGGRAVVAANEARAGADLDGDGDLDDDVLFRVE